MKCDQHSPRGTQAEQGGPTAPPVWVAHGEQYDGESRGTMCWTQSRNPALTNDPVHGCPSYGEGCGA